MQKIRVKTSQFLLFLINMVAKRRVSSLSHTYRYLGALIEFVTVEKEHLMLVDFPLEILDV